MRLKKAKVTKYRSVHDSGWFECDLNKTILVGPNEAGKTATLQALQRLGLPEGGKGFEALKDYPRSEYNDIHSGKVDPAEVTVVSGIFELDDDDKAEIPKAFHGCSYQLSKKLNNTYVHSLINEPSRIAYSDVKDDLLRLAVHMDANSDSEEKLAGDSLKIAVSAMSPKNHITVAQSKVIQDWLDEHTSLIEEDCEKELSRKLRIEGLLEMPRLREGVLGILFDRKPTFVLFSNYFRVKPQIHLAHLAARIEQDNLDDEYFDYGNKCLLQLLGFEAKELSDLGRPVDPAQNDSAAVQAYQSQLNTRSYQLNSASVKLTTEIRKVWAPNKKRDEADTLRLTADGQYLKVVVEDDLGVEIELDQRSEGFQWLVSFFVVFFAQAAGEHKNAILLLDEPGLSLHGLKQGEFRKTLSLLAENNQTIYTTHSPFLVGPDELDLVRVVEMTDRTVGTKIHETVTAEDPAGLLPLQEALGYSLAQSLFGQQRNLILEGLTDYWYVEAMSELINDDSKGGILNSVALVPASSASRVVYFATILHAQKLKVAALLDSDAAGDQVAKQDTLVHTLGNKAIIRTKDVYEGGVAKSEIEDLLRETLIQIANDQLSWDISKKAASQPKRPVIDIFEAEISDFSKYKLAKSFLRWSRTAEVADFQPHEIKAFKSLFKKVNAALK